VLEFPQSGERFAGVGNFREWRRNYPASTKVDFREIRGRELKGDLRRSAATHGDCANLDRVARSTQPWRAWRVAAEIVLTTYITAKTKKAAPTTART
jgi:hypothetical protein